MRIYIIGNDGITLYREAPAAVNSLKEKSERRSIAFPMGGPHRGGPHGTPLRLVTRSRHGRRAPRGAPLHGGRQRQIRGSVPSHGARGLEVRIHLPPARSQQRTLWLPGASHAGGTQSSIRFAPAASLSQQ